jgi:hypothetical protein
MIGKHSLWNLLSRKAPARRRRELFLRIEVPSASFPSVQDAPSIFDDEASCSSRQVSRFSSESGKTLTVFSLNKHQISDFLDFAFLRFIHN